MLRTNCVVVHGKLLTCEPRYTEADKSVLYGYRLKILVDVTPEYTDEVKVFVSSQVTLPGYIKNNSTFSDEVIKVFGKVTSYGIAADYVTSIHNE